MRRLLALLAVLALLLALAPPVAGGGAILPRAAAAAGPRIGVVTAGSPLTDPVVVAQVWAGAKAGAKAITGTVQGIVPAADPDAYAWAIEWFIQADYDAVVTIGYPLIDATLAAARAHAGVQFIGVDQDVPASGAPANYQRLVFDEWQSGYLAGIVAAAMTRSGTIGAVGGMQSVPAVVDFIEGYRAGALATKADANVLVAYAGTFAAPGPAEDAATTQVGQRADVIFEVAGGAGLGVFSAACDAHAYAIGVDVDMYVAQPAFAGCILTSAEKRYANATTLAIRRFAASGIQGGEFMNDASNGGVGLSPIRNVKVPKSVTSGLKAALAALAGGSITR